MAPPAAKTTQKAEDVPPVRETGNCVDEFFSFIDQYCAHGKYRALRETIRESETLREEMKELRIAYKKNMEEQAKDRTDFGAEKRANEQQLRDEKIRYDQALKDKETAERAVKAEKDKSAKLKSEILSRDEDIKKLTHAIKKHETQNAKLENKYRAQAAELDKAKAQEARLNADLEVKTDQLSVQSSDLIKAQEGLQTVQSFIVPLATLEQQRDQVCGALNSAFSEALTFFQAFFRADLDKDVFESRAAWDNVRDHPAIHRVIPLPASNSPPAKRMRAIAALVVYAYALTKQVFRPTYVIQNNPDDLDRTLDALATESPLQEAYVRAVLLRISPSGHEGRRETCVTLVTDEVAGTVGGWVSAELRDSFRASVKSLCDTVCRDWERVQHLEDRVRPCFVFELPEDWQRLPSPAPAKVQNGVLQEPSPRQDINEGQITNERQRQQHVTQPDMVVEDDVVTVIWPAFLASNPSQADEALDLLHSGYVLTQADIEHAEAEVSEMSRRASRKAHRKNGSTASRPRRDSGIFLSSGGSGEPAAK